MVRVMYKLVVEDLKWFLVIAYGYVVDEEILRKLQSKCAEKVKHNKGIVSFENVNKSHKL